MLFGMGLSVRRTAVATGPLLSYAPGGAITFSGSNSPASYRDSGGAWQAGASNVVRDNHYEWDPVASAMARTTLLEAARVNILVTPGTPATQTVNSVVAGYYVCWMEGSGSVAVSGATSGAYGTVTGNPNNGTVTGVQGTDWLLFNVTVTQNVTFTVSGSVTKFNCVNFGAGTTQYPTPRSYVSSNTNAAADTGTFTFTALPQEMTVYIRYIHFGFAVLGTATLFRIGNFSGARFRLYAQSNRWLVAHHNGTAEIDTVLNFGVTVSPTVPDPYVGQLLEVRAVLNANGSCQLHLTRDNGSETSSSVSGTTVALTSAWSAGTFHLGSPASATAVNGAFRNLQVLSGVVSRADCRIAAGI